MLSPPGANKFLALLALGRGTFNYSCEDAQPANAPAFKEQYTELYDATPLLPLSSDEDYFHDLIEDLYKYDYGQNMNSTLECVGSIGTLHGTAVVTLYEIDIFDAYIEESHPSHDEPDVNGVWAHSRSPDGNWEMYRVRMVGGAVPKTCQGWEGSFDVPYAAEYWFFHA
jgi:Protein of unknown function (DUF3455)